jgi:hypothetical protein
MRLKKLDPSTVEGEFQSEPFILDGGVNSDTPPSSPFLTLTASSRVKKTDFF